MAAAAGDKPLDTSKKATAPDAATSDVDQKARQAFANELLDKRQLIVQPQEGYYQTLKRVVPELKDEEASHVAHETKRAMKNKDPLHVGDPLPIVDRPALVAAIARSAVLPDKTAAAPVEATPAPQAALPAPEAKPPAAADAKLPATAEAPPAVAPVTIETKPPVAAAKGPETPGEIAVPQGVGAPVAAVDATPKPSTEKLEGIASTSHWLAAKAESAFDTAGRIATVTREGLLSTDTLKGLYNAAKYDVLHPGETATMLVESAAMGASLKFVMSEKGPVGAVGGLAIGGYFLAKSAAPMADAYKKAIYATNDQELHAAGKELADAAGAFTVNTGVGMAGYRIGAGTMGRTLEGEKFDQFAEAKEAVWEKINGKTISFAKSLVGKGGEASSDIGLSMEARTAPMAFKVVGERAHLLDTAKAAPKGTVTGEVDPNATVNITLLAKTKGSPLLMDRYINRISNRGAAPLTDAEITAKFGTDEASGKAIEKFAADHGLKINDVNHASGRYFLEAPAEKMAKAFGVNWQEYTQDGVSFRGRTGTLSVTPEVAPHVRGILGLDNRPQYHTNIVKLADYTAAAAGAEAAKGAPVSPLDAIAKAKPSSAAGKVSADGTAGDGTGTVIPEAPKPKGPPPGVRPLTVAENLKSMNAPEGLKGKGQVTGFLSLGGDMGEDPTMWPNYMKSKGIDPDTFKTINLNREAPQTDPQGANGENQLDAVIHKEGLPEATTVMVQAPNNDSGMPDGIDRMTFPKAGEDQITHASISWGQYEDGWTAQARAAMNDAGKRAALKNITITVAAGDNGSFDNSPSRKQQVDIPAGLSMFTGVGGSLLKVDGKGNYVSETAWSGMGATGGGRSLVEPRPIWQKLLDLPKNLTGSLFDGRGVPDIAANAHPWSGLLTPTDSGIQAIGGTSEAAPLTAVAANIVTQGSGVKTGFWNPKIYTLPRNSFRDITTGNNTDSGIPGYKAGPGYDLVTGQGSPHVANLIDNYKADAGKSATAKFVADVPKMVARPQGTHIPGFLLPASQLTDKELEEKKAAGAYK